MNAQHSISVPPRRLRGFTITELLVVIGIIVLLAGILLVALGKVRSTAMRTSTTGTMQGFLQACDAFHTEHQQYPGVIPERVLARAIANGQVTVSGAVSESPASFTSTENALLHLMGGYRVVSPSDVGTITEQDYNDFNISGGTGYEFTFGTGNSQWKLKVNPRQIGEGPVINRQQYAPYFTPSASMMGDSQGQMAPGQISSGGGGLGSASPGTLTEVRLPDLLDSWGQPILYFRQIREHGPNTQLVGPVNPANDNDPRPQFVMEGSLGYLDSNALGNQAQNQRFNSSTNPRGSILSRGVTPGNLHANFAQLLRNPAFGEWHDKHPLNDVDNRRQIRARGTIAVFSAGQDGIFFSATDGPGYANAPVTDLTVSEYNNPQSIEEYDDIRIFGGG